MKADKVKTFMKLAGQSVGETFESGDLEQRKLGAQLLLSEVLEYVIVGLGITPEVNGVKITDPEAIDYVATENAPNKLEMIDGLADVAYTMYWNANAFGVNLEDAYELVCDNNLSKFVKLEDWKEGEGPIDPAEWDCGRSIEWPQEVRQVSVVKVKDSYYAVGKDVRGKVRKPSSYVPVDLSCLV